MIKRNQKIVADIEAFKEKQNIEVKCISDRILLYLRWGAEKLQLEDDGFTMDLYHKIRGDPKYTSKNPKAIAAALLYLGLMFKGMPVLQFTITNLYDLAPYTIRKNYNEIIKDFNLKVPTKK